MIYITHITHVIFEATNNFIFCTYCYSYLWFIFSVLYIFLNDGIGNLNKKVVLTLMIIMHIFVFCFPLRQKVSASWVRGRGLMPSFWPAATFPCLC